MFCERKGEIMGKTLTQGPSLRPTLFGAEPSCGSPPYPRKIFLRNPFSLSLAPKRNDPDSCPFSSARAYWCRRSLRLSPLFSEDLFPQSELANARSKTKRPRLMILRSWLGLFLIWRVSDYSFFSPLVEPGGVEPPSKRESHVLSTCLSSY